MLGDQPSIRKIWIAADFDAPLPAHVLDAFNHNYRVIVPVEAVCDRGETSHKVTLFDIHMKYGHVVPQTEVLDYLKTVRAGEARLALEEIAAR